MKVYEDYDLIYYDWWPIQLGQNNNQEFRPISFSLTHTKITQLVQSKTLSDLHPTTVKWNTGSNIPCTQYNTVSFYDCFLAYAWLRTYTYKARPVLLYVWRFAHYITSFKTYIDMAEKIGLGNWKRRYRSGHARRFYSMSLRHLRYRLVTATGILKLCG